MFRSPQKPRTWQKLLSFLVLFMLSAITIKAQVTGTVFRDFNGNGTRDTNEPLVSGITVNAYNTSGTLCGTTTTAGTSAPNYSVVGCGTGQVRVEFIIPTSGNCVNSNIDFSSFVGSNNSTSVQFVNGNSTNVNFALHNPNDYNLGATGVEVFIPAYISGDPLVPGTVANSDWFFSYPYTNSGTRQATPATRVLNGSIIGSVWGVAYSKQANKVFTSAFLKRHTGLGVLGTGGIYMLTPTATSFNVNQFYNLDANGHRTRADGTAPAYGEGTSYSIASNSIVTYLGSTDALTGKPSGLGVVGSNSARGLTSNPLDPSFDPAAFDQVGKVGLGDIEISDDGRYLFVMNLYSRRVFRLELNDAYNPTSVVNVTSYAIPNPGCTNGEYRPFALKYSRGKLYAGVVCSAENGGTSANEFAYVYELNNPIGAASFNTSAILTTALNYSRPGSDDFNPWTNNSNISSGDRTSPIVSDIEFTDNGDLVLGIMDRAGHQWGENNRLYLKTTTSSVSVSTNGDILAAGFNCATGTFTTENNGSFTSATGATFSQPGTNSSQGPGGKEFFNDDAPSDPHDETHVGALAILKGAGHLLMTAFAQNTRSGDGGTVKLSTTNGSIVSGSYYEINNRNDYNDGVFAKANGMGDIELTGAESPIQVGNRVWIDTDGDGIQDAGENPLAGVTVQLLNNSGVVIATAVTDASGNYYFSSAAGTTTSSAIYGISSLTNNSNYSIRIPNVQGGSKQAVLGSNSLTTANSDITTNGDVRDSDGILSGDNAVVSFTTGDAGENNHSYDFGFSPVIPSSLGDYVWYDTDRDGIQDAGETGVNGVKVYLLNAGGTKIDSTTTNASGFYQFTNLTPGTYGVQFNLSTLPSGYVVSSANQGADDTKDSDANTTTGIVPNVTLAPGENNPTLDMGINQPPSSLGDYVWYDTDRDGIQDAGETGVNNVKVYLLNSVGTKIDSTTTNASGFYQFTNLTPGTYGVQFNLSTLPSGYVVSSANQGSDDTKDSDANTTTGIVPNVTLAPGENNPTLDMGINQPAVIPSSLGDYVWYDTDRDGIQDAGETGVNGVKVYLLNAGGTKIDSTTTNASGFYQFTNLTPGTYGVQFNLSTLPSGYVVSSANQGADDTKDSDANTTTGIVPNVTLAPGENNPTLDMGINQPPSSLGDYVWYDTDRDGVQDAGETGVNGVKVYLLNAGGTKIDSTTTNASGFYQFTNLTPGTYGVQFNLSTLPSGYVVSSANQGSDDTKDSDANTTTGIVPNVTLAPGENNPTLDMGINQPPVPPSPCVAPVVNFDWQYNGSCLTYDFNSNSTIASGWITSYFWDFGNGQTSTQSNPLATYPVAGTYNVKLVVTSNLGCKDSIIFPVNIINKCTNPGAGGTTGSTGGGGVSPCPTVGAITGNTSLCVGGTSALADTTAGGTWSSSNTAVATVSGTGVVTAISAGSTTISYIVVRPCGTVAVSTTVNVSSNSAQPIIAQDSVCISSTISLNNSNSGGVYTLSNANASLSGNNLTGVTAGNVTVTYTVTTPCGTFVTTKVIRVVNCPVPVTCHSNWYSQNATTNCDSTLRFIAGSPISGATYAWTFGDGTTGTGNPVTHKYPSEGTYMVKLVATNGTCKDSTSYNVYVSNCSVTGGGGGGIESKTLGTVISQRLYGKAVSNQSQDLAIPTQGFTKSTAVVNGPADLKLSDLVPASVAGTDRALISSPTDLVNFTNALEVLSVDYTRSNINKAVAFGTRTAGDVYSHTKPICDRLRGAELLEVKTLNINGYNVMAYQIRQRTGELEYAMNLNAGVKVGRSSISVQSNWFTDSYVRDETMFNFQLWAVSYEMVGNMAKDIITKLQQTGTVQAVTNSDLPVAYVSKGNRVGTKVNVTVQNNTSNTTGYFEIREKQNEGSVETVRTVPFTVGANKATNVEVPVQDYYEGSMYMYVGGKLTDLLYLSDGTWALDYNKNNTTISKFQVENELNPREQAGEYRLMRNVTVQGTSKDYITVYKTMNGGGIEQNLSNYKGIKFTTDATGLGQLNITIVKKGIQNWSDQYSYTINLDGSSKEYAIGLSQFRSSRTPSTPINANDVLAVNFGYNNTRGGNTAASINLSKVRFTTVDVAAQQALQSKQINIYPNPIQTGVFTASFTSELDQAVVLRVVEIATGKTVKLQFVEAKKGKNQVQVQLDKATNNGMYSVQVQGDNGNYESQKVMVNRK